jgi:hypothetical protein
LPDSPVASILLPGNGAAVLEWATDWRNIMPLLDHFRPPLRRRRHWESFHNAWATFIAQQLNGILPPNFAAEVQVKLSVQVEADVATLEEEERTEGEDNGAVATAVWAPPRPAISVGVDFADIDLFEVQIIRDDADVEVVAAVELVSPANKDRATTRRAFAITCASYLHQGIGVAVVDVVTGRRANLHTELFDLLDLAPTEEALGHLYATAYRTITRRKKTRLEAWTERLALGGILPTVPVWIASDRAVPLDLEQSYLATCAALRIRG